MQSYNPQPILKKKWGKEKRAGVIRIRRHILKSTLKEKPRFLFLAYLVNPFLGNDFCEYLGESDYLGRPIKI